jgi:hypothetical protein
MSAKNDADFFEEDDGNKKCPPQDASRSQKDKTKCPPQHITASNPREEMASHKAATGHTLEHRHHRHTNRKRHSRESSDRHKAASKKHDFLSDEREQIERATDRHGLPGPSPKEWRLNGDAFDCLLSCSICDPI